jgi:tRNA(fMet)-specific endonuclease VapC
VDLVRFFAAWQIVPFDDGAARASLSLKKQRLRIGTMDLKIAATPLSNDALLLTANRKDFGLVPGLRFENWLD